MRATLRHIGNDAPSRRALLVTALLASLHLGRLAAAQQAPASELDHLLDRLVGSWEMVGQVQGEPATFRLDTRRVLQGKFIELHMDDVARPPQYEARVFIGVDSAAGGYIAHWLDNFGAPSSIPHGTGGAVGDTLTLRFAYPSAEFRDTFTYDSASGRWRLLVESIDSRGTRSVFADYWIRRRELNHSTPTNSRPMPSQKATLSQ